MPMNSRWIRGPGNSLMAVETMELSELKYVVRERGKAVAAFASKLDRDEWIAGYEEADRERLPVELEDRDGR